MPWLCLGSVPRQEYIGISLSRPNYGASLFAGRLGFLPSLVPPAGIPLSWGYYSRSRRCCWDPARLSLADVSTLDSSTIDSSLDHAPAPPPRSRRSCSASYMSET